jgi:hypothetical protein
MSRLLAYLFGRACDRLVAVVPRDRFIAAVSSVALQALLVFIAVPGIMGAEWTIAPYAC